MADYRLYGWFVASKQGKAGLTVTVDVRNSAGTLVVTGGAATEIGGGLYTYLHSTATEDDYTAVFKTADTSVDAQHVPSLVAVQQPRLDAAVSSRSTLTAQQVWEYATRTLSSFGSLVADIWANATRTLTQTAAQVAAILSGSTITVMRGDDWSIVLTGLGDVSGNQELWFTAKASPSVTDAMADVQISRTVGLVRLNGAAGTAAQGSIVVNDAAAGNITITLAAAASAGLAPTVMAYDVQVKDSTGAIHTLTSGMLTVTNDITRANE